MTLVNKSYLAIVLFSSCFIFLFLAPSCNNSEDPNHKKDSHVISVPISVGCNSIISGNLNARRIVAMVILRDTAFFYMKEPSYFNRVRKSWYDSLGEVQETERDFPDSELLQVEANDSAFFLSLENLKTEEEVDYIDPKILASISSESKIDSLKGKIVKFHEGYLFLGSHSLEVPYQHILYMNKFTKKMDTLSWHVITQEEKFTDFYVHEFTNPAIPVLIFVGVGVTREGFYFGIVPLTSNCFVNELK